MSDETPVPAATFPIVGVGASAGGLEAFTKLLRALPVDTGMAFVLVQHLAPSHASALADILGRATSMPVREVENRATVEPDHVYVIPPGQDLGIYGGSLQLSPRTESGQHRPIDEFFRTLAGERGHEAIGVVLSGTGNDGTLGLEAIKAEGGITFAQDGTAQHDGMPQSATASGCVDFVLPPKEIAREIVRIGRQRHELPDAGSQDPDGAPKLAPILRHLRRATGVDFTHYKFSTLYRRISRRMLLRKTTSLDDYAQLLQESPSEIDALFQDILINVTSFFRNPDAFEALATKTFPRLVKDRSRTDPVRMWVVGCSTGQEAYSLAIAFAEFSEAAQSSVPLQVFATDVNPSAVEKARAGVFPEGLLQEVSPTRLQRFFVKVDGSYRISKAIRDTCLFSRHNVLVDPPFSRIDLLSCRNLLIYLEPVLQQRVLPTLHFALRPSGYLWLGGSETVGSHQNLFETQDSKHKIYTKRSGSGVAHVPLQQSDAPPKSFTPATTRASDSAAELQRAADRFLLSKFTPPGVLVSADLEVVQYRGETAPYLTPAPGKASLSILKMLREGLLVPVRAAIQRAERGETPAREEGVRIESDGGHREVAVEVLRILANDSEQAGFLILFEDTARVRHAQAAKLENAPASSEQQSAEQDRARLAEQLAATHEYLQSVIEQQEAANEELQSANEEVQSANEELQSINEELETSKEEIQSSNEELAIMNDELNTRNAELNRINDDLGNLLGSVEMPIVILGRDLRVRRFTAAAEALLNLLPSDVGRPVGAIKLGLALDDLELLLAQVLRSGSAPDREVQDLRGRWYSLRLRPYKTVGSEIDGVILMLVDVNLLERAREYAESIVTAVREPLLVLDREFRVRTANPAFYETFRWSPKDVEGRLLGDLGNRQWDSADLRRLLAGVMAQGGSFSDFVVRDDTAEHGERTMLLHARRLVQDLDLDPSILLAIEDVTERLRLQAEPLQAELRKSAELLEADRRKNEFLAMLAHELRNPLAPIRNALSILEVSSDPQMVSQMREMMQRQVDQMVRLVDDLLDVSRITTGRIELRKGRLSLASIVSHAVEVARPTCDAMGLSLTLSLPPVSVYVHGDPTRLAQVVGNLLNNASKFTDSGGHVWVSVVREGDQAVIRFRDSGVGVAADQIEHIFEMFAQIDASLERSRTGLGIGLTLVRTLVELHDGTVEVHSDGLGQGSEFVVRLPALRDAEDRPSEPQLTKRAPTKVRRILVVDDNRDSAESLATLLRLNGNETRTAFDGLEAVEAASAFRPDMVLLDLGLPKLNGFEAARRLRQEPWAKGLILVAMTGWGQDADRQKTKDAGFDAHLVKPVDHAQLAKLLAAS